jgi:hypothetical protein
LGRNAFGEKMGELRVVNLKIVEFTTEGSERSEGFAGSVRCRAGEGMRNPARDCNAIVTIAFLRGVTEFLKAHAETFLELVKWSGERVW